MSNQKAYFLFLGAILVLALSLRVWGLTWALPNQYHYFSYHPDEGVVLQAAMGMNVFSGHLLPHFYNYGSLQLYLVLFANSLLYLFGVVNIVIRDFATDHAQWARMYLIGRSLTVAMGVGTVWAVAAIGTRLWGRRAGLLSALILAIMPLHVQHSHWLTVDVPATFWAMLSLVWAVRLAQPNEPKPWRAALLAGIFAGFAAATKYNLVLVVLPVVLACALRPPGSRLRPVAPMLLGCGAAFLIGCPGAVLDSAKFLADVKYEARHVRTQPGQTFQDTGNGFVYHVMRNLAAGLGWPLLLFSLLAIVYAIYRRQRGDGLLAAFALPYYILIGLAVVRYARYDIPLLPILALWAGRLVADVLPVKRGDWRKIGTGILTVVLATTLFATGRLVEPMARPDPRDQAAAWLHVHAPAPATIGFAALPWFQTPPLSPMFSQPRPGFMRDRASPDDLRRFAYFDKEWDSKTLAVRPQFVVISEYDYMDALRLRDPATQAYLDALNGDYAVAEVFDSWNAKHVMRPSELPHDMLYPSPMIWIYERRTSP